MLLPCMIEIRMGEDSWRDPYKFDPTRFIEDGQFKRYERVIPFQTGRGCAQARGWPGRSCSSSWWTLFRSSSLSQRGREQLWIIPSYQDSHLYDIAMTESR